MTTALWWGALWWAGNLAVALVALPLLVVEAGRIMRSLRTVTAAAGDIAGSVESVAASVPPVTASLATVAAHCRRLEPAAS